MEQKEDKEGYPDLQDSTEQSEEPTSLWEKIFGYIFGFILLPLMAYGFYFFIYSTLESMDKAEQIYGHWYDGILELIKPSVDTVGTETDWITGLQHGMYSPVNWIISIFVERPYKLETSDSVYNISFYCGLFSYLVIFLVFRLKKILKFFK